MTTSNFNRSREARHVPGETVLAHFADTPAPAMVGALDMTDGNDRREVRKAVKLSWPTVTDEFKEAAVKALRYAMALATDAKDHRSINGCVQTLAVLVGQNQRDEHHATAAPINHQTLIVNNDLRDAATRDPAIMRELLTLRAQVEDAANPPTGPTNGQVH